MRDLWQCQCQARVAKCCKKWTQFQINRNNNGGFTDKNNCGSECKRVYSHQAFVSTEGL